MSSIDELAAQVGQIAAAAALAHDIGNPPFGHIGEQAIGNWFKDNSAGMPQDLSAEQRSDLEDFEGNAQGFRILVHLANVRGLDLTAATLGAFTKYPTCSTARTKNYIGHKKYGYFEAERSQFLKVATELGLIETAPGQWKRHPLAFLVEAADDICYRIIDVEDGVKLGKISENEAEKCLAALLTGSHQDDYKHEKRNKKPVELGWLRAKAIGSLIDATQTAFIANEDAILMGTFTGPLLDSTPMARHLKKVKELVRDRVFTWDRTVKAEIAGSRMLTLLLDDFMGAVMAPKKNLNLKLLSLIPDFPAEASSYDKILRVTDYISGMTDTFLLQTFRQVHGHSISGT